MSQEGHLPQHKKAFSRSTVSLALAGGSKVAANGQGTKQEVSCLLSPHMRSHEALVPKSAHGG